VKVLLDDENSDAEMLLIAENRVFSTGTFAIKDSYIVTILVPRKLVVKTPVIQIIMIKAMRPSPGIEKPRYFVKNGPKIESRSFRTSFRMRNDPYKGSNTINPVKKRLLAEGLLPKIVFFAMHSSYNIKDNYSIKIWKKQVFFKWLNNNWV
jgi:hypothetical protein